MFTGIVESVGTIAALQPLGRMKRIDVEAPDLAPHVGLGDSVSVSGACLTIVRPDASLLCFEAVRETIDRTSLGGLALGSRVNLERAMRADARLDGHIVQGHVDETGRVVRLQRQENDVRLFVQSSSDFADLLVEKGSIAIDGVSLTVVGAQRDGFDVVLVPHTLEVTTLGTLEPGAPVNLEADVLGKYVRRYLERLFPEARGGVA